MPVAMPQVIFATLLAPAAPVAVAQRVYCFARRVFARFYTLFFAFVFIISMLTLSRRHYATSFR
jgi:hypothetical protein